MLTLQNITYAWPGAAPCLSNLDLTLEGERGEGGEGLALIGPSGAGKSTLLRIAAGLLYPQAGTVCVAGRKIKSLPARERAATIGVLFQEAERQIFHATVREEVCFGLRQQGFSETDMRSRCEEALELCGLADVVERHPLDLHAGNRRMVAVACLAALRPPVLLLDEPSRDFDAIRLHIFENWLHLSRKSGDTVLAISHDPDFVARNFSTIVRLDQGRVVKYTAIQA